MHLCLLILSHFKLCIIQRPWGADTFPLNQCQTDSQRFSQVCWSYLQLWGCWTAERFNRKQQKLSSSSPFTSYFKCNNSVIIRAIRLKLTGSLPPLVDNIWTKFHVDRQKCVWDISESAVQSISIRWLQSFLKPLQSDQIMMRNVFMTLKKCPSMFKLTKSRCCSYLDKDWQI